MLLVTKDVFSHWVKVVCFLCIVGGTEQQHHAFKDYTHVGVFQVSLYAKFVPCQPFPGFAKSLTAEDTILRTLHDGVYLCVAIPAVVGQS